MLFYIWGIMNVLSIIITLFYDKKFIESRETDKPFFKKKTSYQIKSHLSTLTWCFIGLFSSQSLWFVFYFIYIFLIRKIIKVDLLNKPTRFNIELNRLIKISIFLIVLFPIVNHFYLDINIFNYFSDILQQCESLYRI